LIDAARRRLRLRERVAAELAAGPAPGASPQLAEDDAAMHADFVAEAHVLVRAAERALTSDAAGRDEINAALRAFHTIKGTSSFLGRDQVARLAHHAESVLVAIREGVHALDTRRLILLLRACQRLRAVLDDLHADPDGLGSKPTARDGPLLNDLEEAARGHSAVDGSTHAPRVLSQPSSDICLAPRNAPTLSAVMGARAPDATTRVQTDRLDQVSALVTALGTTLLSETRTGDEWWPDAVRMVHELQRAAQAVRRVPLRGPLHRVRRVVRETSAQTAKTVTLEVEGDETEVDCGVAEVLGEALVHLARNAVDHGIEPPAERAAAGKADAGTLRLHAFRDGEVIVIEFSDDGRGLARERLLATAVDRGLLSPDDHERLSDDEVCDLIFEPGFSTARQVTDLSGRGVGLDVVRRSAEALGGSATVRSLLGAGTTFVLTVAASTSGRASTT
jgi:two-component system chemotaxis sensor kinase CheA